MKGELIAAIGMTEPGAGSDIAGIRTSAVDAGDHFVVNGAKTFITNGQNADLVITAVAPPPTATAGSRCWCSNEGCQASNAAATSTSWACTARTPPSWCSPT